MISVGAPWLFVAVPHLLKEYCLFAKAGCLHSHLWFSTSLVPHPSSTK